MNTVLIIKDSYEVASVTDVNEPDAEYYRTCGIISKRNLEAIIGENKVAYIESNLYYAIENDEDEEIETDTSFDYIEDCFANEDFYQDEDYDGEYWLMAKCEYKITFTELVTQDDINQLKAYIVRAASINEENIEETHE